MKFTFNPRKTWNYNYQIMSSETLSSENFSKWLINCDEVEWNKNKVLGAGSYGTVYKGEIHQRTVLIYYKENAEEKTLL
jgi:hypothetical protein